MAVDSVPSSSQLLWHFLRLKGVSSARVVSQAVPLSLLAVAGHTVSLKRVLVTSDEAALAAMHSCVRKLEVDQCQFDPGAFEALLEHHRDVEDLRIAVFRGSQNCLLSVLSAVERLHSLRILDLDDCSLHSVNWSCAFRNLRWRPLKELHLARNSLTARDAKALFSAVGTQREIAIIDLAENALGDEGVLGLREWLESSTAKLQRLSLSDNLIGPSGAVTLGKLVLQQRELRVLYVARNPLTDVGIAALFRSSHQLDIVDLTDTHCSCRSLLAAFCRASHVVLNDNQLTVYRKDCEVRCGDFARLRKVALAGSLLGDEGIALIARGKDCFQKLKSANFSSCGITPQGVPALRELLSSTDSLTELLIPGNCVRSEGLIALQGTLKRLKGLKQLDLKQNLLGTAGAVVLANALTHLQDLRTLKLSENPIGNEGIAAIASSLSSTPLLSALHIADTHIDSRACEVLGAALRGLPRLKYLHIGRNRVADSGLTALLPALRSLKTLKALSLSYTLISDEVLDPLFGVLSALVFLTQLNCDGNKLSPLFLRLLHTCKYLTHVSARKNEFNSGRETVRWDLRRDVNFAYSKVNSFESAVQRSYCENVRMGGCNLLTRNWNQLFQQCGSFLRTLQLEDNHLKADGLALLFKQSPFLSSLSLSNVLLDCLDCGWGHLAASLQSLTLTNINTLSGEQRLRSVLLSVPLLKRLSFTHNTLSTRDQGETMQTLSTLSQLEELDITNLRDCSAFHLADCLPHLHNLRSLQLTGCPAAERKLAYVLRVLRRLDSLRIRNFADKGFVKELGTSLQTLRLKELEIAGSLLSLQQVEAMCEGLKSQWSLKHFTLCNCKLSSSGVQQVLSSLSGCQLEDIDISGNALSFTSISPLCEFLGTQRALRELRVNGLCLPLEQVAEFGAAVLQSQVRVLSVDGSQVADFPQFLLAIGESQTLTTLSISNCGVTDSTLRAMLPLIAATNHLHTLQLNFNKLTHEVLHSVCAVSLRKQVSVAIRGNAITTADLDAVTAEYAEEDGWFLDERVAVR